MKRSKERRLEEGIQLLRQIPEAQLRGLEESQLLLLVRLLLSMQVQMVSISTACRKVDQVSPTVCLSHCTMLKIKWNLIKALYLLYRCCNICQRWIIGWFLEKHISVCTP